MDSHFFKLLQNIGLDTWEARIYLAMLPLGPSSVLDISTASGIERTMCYRVLGRLSQKRLVTRVTDDRKTKYYAERPTVLYRLVSEQKERLAREENELHATFPVLLDHYNKHKNTLGIKYFQGVTGFGAIMEHVSEQLEREEIHSIDILCYGDEERLLEFIRKYYPRYFRLRLKNQISARVLSPSGSVLIHEETTEVEIKLDQRFPLPFKSSQTLYEIILPNSWYQLFIGDYDFLGLITEHESFIVKAGLLFEYLLKGDKDAN